MLHRVLEAVEASDGAIDLRTLSRALGVAPSALEGMIQFWVRKGRLVDSSAGAAGGDSAAAECSPCGPSCVGTAECPFIVTAPRTVAVADSEPRS